MYISTIRERLNLLADDLTEDLKNFEKAEFGKADLKRSRTILIKIAAQEIADLFN
jgi:hypothetical protein